MNDDAALPLDSLFAEASWIRRLARRLVGDAARADDLVQETLLAALERRPDADRPLRPWLARVLRNRALVARRGAGRRSAREEDAAREEVDERGADELVARAEAQRALVGCVTALRDPYRSVLLLRYYEGLDAAAIAERRGASPATVRSQLKRGLEELRASLDGEFGERGAWCLAFAPLLADELAAVLAEAAGASKAAGGGLMALPLVAKLAAAALVVAATGFGAAGFLAHRSSSSTGDELVAAPASSGATVPRSREPLAHGAAIGGVGEREPVDRASVASPPAPLQGVLRDARFGRPLADYRLVIAAGDGPSEELQTDGEGRFASERAYAPGPLTIAFLDDPRVSRSQTLLGVRLPLRVQNREREVEWVPGRELALTVEVGPTFALDVLAPPGIDLGAARLSLVGRLPNGQPVREHGWAHPRGGGASWARFQPFDELPEAARWALALRAADGAWMGTAPLDGAPQATAEPTPVRIELEPCARLQVVLADTRPQPESVRLELEHVDGAVPYSDRGEVAAGTPFVFGWLRAGEYTLRAHAPGFEAEERTLTLYAAERGISELWLRPTASDAWLRGELRSRSGTLRLGAAINALHVETDVLSTVPVRPDDWIERDGELVVPFELEGLEPGEYRFDPSNVPSLFRLNWTLPARVEAPAEGIVLVIEDEEPRARVELSTVSAETGEPLGGNVLLVDRSGKTLLYVPGIGPVDELPVAGLRWRAQASGHVPLFGTLDDLELEERVLGGELALEPGWGDAHRRRRRERRAARGGRGDGRRVGVRAHRRRRRTARAVRGGARADRGRRARLRALRGDARAVRRGSASRSRWCCGACSGCVRPIGYDRAADDPARPFAGLRERPRPLRARPTRPAPALRLPRGRRRVTTSAVSRPTSGTCRTRRSRIASNRGTTCSSTAPRTRRTPRTRT